MKSREREKEEKREETTSLKKKKNSFDKKRGEGIRQKNNSDENF